jgi:hypothetical protein
MSEERGAMDALYKRKEELISEREQVIERLRSQLARQSADTIPLGAVLAEAKVLFPEIDDLQFGRFQNSSAISETVQKRTAGAAWLATSKPISEKESAQLSRWLATRTGLDTVLLFR